MEASIQAYNLPDGILAKIYVVYNCQVVFHMDILYMNCVLVLKACFKQINDNLMNLVEPETNGDPHILRGTYYNERNQLMELMALKKQHLAISNTVQVLNKIFRLQLLVTITRTFTEITFLLYFLLMRRKIGLLLVDTVNSKTYDIFLIYGITRCVLKTAILAWTCEISKNQAVDINITVHSVLNNISDKEMKREVN